MVFASTKRKGFTANVSVYMFSTMVTFILPVIVLPIYTRYLSPADFGIVVLFMMFGNLTAGLISCNLHFSTYRLYFDHKNDQAEFSKVNSTNMIAITILFIIFGVIFTFFAQLISSYLFNDLLSNKLIMWSYFSGCMDYFILYMTSILTAQIRSIAFTTVTIFRSILDVLLTFYFIFFESLTFMARINSILIVQPLVVIALLILLRNFIKPLFSIKRLNASLALSIPVIPSNLIGMIQSSFDKLMLGNFIGANSIGYYSFSERFSRVLKLVSDSLGKVWDPLFLDLSSESSDNQKIIIDKFYKLIFLFMIVGLSVIYFSEEMIKILTTEAFYPSMYVTPVYVYFFLFSFIGKIAMNQITFAKKMIYLLPASLFGIVINIVLNLLLIPKYGTIGAAIATSISALFINGIHLYFGMRLFPLPLEIFKIVNLYLLVILFTIIAYPLMNYEINFFLKILCKSVMISLFFLIGLRLDYIKSADISRIYYSLKPN